MKLLQIGAGNMFGGIERLLVGLARFDHSKGEIDREFAVSFRGRLSEELKRHGAVVHHIGNVRFRFPWTVWWARRRLARLLAKKGYDVVVCHANWPYAIAAPIVRKSGAALLYWAHDAVLQSHRWSDSLIRTPPDAVIANSSYTAGRVREFVPCEDVQVLYHPLDSEAAPGRSVRLSVRTEMGVANDEVIVVCANRLEAWKGHLPLIRALGGLQTPVRWRCWFIGGPQRRCEEEHFRTMQELAQSAGVADRVQFLGQRNDVARLFAGADVFCQPNIEPEPFGVAFIEALQAGLPVVTTAMGGGKEIVDETCGMLTPPRDETALTAALKRLMESQQLRETLGSAGPARAKELCDPERQSSRLAEILRRAMTVRDSREGRIPELEPAAWWT